MTTCVVLLRGVNVGGNNRVAMADLRALLDDVGCRNVQTYLQSGNAVVVAKPTGLARRVEAALQRELGLDVRVMVRTASELADVVAANPFPQRVATPKLLHVAFYDRQPEASVIDEVGADHGNDQLVLGDRVLYLSYAGTSHDSQLVAALRRIGGVSTARNWTTVTKLLTLAQAS